MAGIKNARRTALGRDAARRLSGLGPPVYFLILSSALIAASRSSSAFFMASCAF